MYDEFDYAYEVYKEKSFSQAAKNLYVSQPALSSSIKKLEARFGITIFDRSSQPISLTDEGRVFIDSVESIKITVRIAGEYINIDFHNSFLIVE